MNDIQEIISLRKNLALVHIPAMQTLNTQTHYPSPLRNWNDKSWIRSKPIRFNSIEGLPFPPELVPLASHPDIESSLQLKLQVLAFKLLSHLKFTTVLELEHVNPVCSELGRGLSPATLSLGERNDALKIYCDEGGHALFVELLALSVSQRYGVDPAVLGQPRFHLEIRRILDQYKGIVSESLLHHFFVSVSETLVTKILRDIPQDRRVSAVVREVIGDHANDESTHSVYFRWYFPRLWNVISDRERLVIGKILPEFLWIFLSPDLEVDRNVLKALGFEFEARERMIHEVYDPKKIQESVAQAAVPTLEMFRKAGVFETPEVRKAFMEKQLI